ncbi:MAG TPA: hypothetical protein PKW33_06955 [Anaerolineaceae bacterium]|nr:hypothetical protein [Anaerolineaceae bacterium]HPN51308.1 hypothetical protein [Anaerolineaceae bacterium]
MLDNLRESANQSPFFQDEQPEPEPQPAPEQPKKPKAASGPFLGMTAVQRFVLALILFFMTCVLGGFFLLVTEKIMLPF